MDSKSLQKDRHQLIWLKLIYRVEDDQNLDVHNKFTSSPTKTILGALTPGLVSTDLIIPKKNMILMQDYKASIPEHIEEIPFRRQDRRILYARKKRVVDQNKRTRIFVVLGPVLAVIGIVVMMFSIEVCIRLWRNKKREKDPKIDDVKNIHHIKHWIHPELIPFGWGHRDSLWETSINDADDIQIDLTEESSNQESNLVKVLAQTDISSDIFDESLRYNGIDRPTLSINPSSPIEQICGEFQDPEEKVKNIFL
ncbi:unnamed protein product [Lepeophtheirus salmonis]|uniref:(salmon louse) hypothetical protein n=1 Tax=Lepeophtheirus salmonis TaxID=72036 RepID=A0A817FE55_LEPSM|nr:unnamed protein product [Lepeophtheirus salmonis]